jgi:hypothetical protein
MYFVGKWVCYNCTTETTSEANIDMEEVPEECQVEGIVIDFYCFIYWYSKGCLLSPYIRWWKYLGANIAYWCHKLTLVTRVQKWDVIYQANKFQSFHFVFFHYLCQWSIIEVCIIHIKCVILFFQWQIEFIMIHISSVIVIVWSTEKWCCGFNLM